MAADFVKAVDNLTISADAIKQYNNGDYAHAAFPIFALSSQVTESDLQQAAKVFNDQAQAFIALDEEEFAEMGFAAAIPQPWHLHEKSASDAIQWHLEKFDKRGSGTVDQPQWFPHGFLGIMSTDWKETGVVLAFYNFWYHDGQLPEDKPIPVVAFVLAPQDVGSVLISLRQTEQHINDVKDAYATG